MFAKPKGPTIIHMYVCTSLKFMYAFPCHFGRPLRSTSEFLQLD